MPQAGFELMIPVFERAKTVHALDRAATVIGRSTGIPHTNLPIVKEHFKNLSRINTAAIHTDLSLYIPTEMEPSFISKNVGQEDRHIVPAKAT
jgi:hypothetical protein